MESKVLLQWTKRLWNFIFHVWMIVYGFNQGKHVENVLVITLYTCINLYIHCEHCFSKFRREKLELERWVPKTVQMVWKWHELKHRTPNTERNYFQFYLKSIRTTYKWHLYALRCQNWCVRKWATRISFGYNIESTTIFMVKYCKLNVPT